MAFNTKGITIDIDVFHGKFDEGLRKIKQEVQGVDHEMNKLSRTIRNNGNSFNLFSSSQRLLSDKVGNLKKQIDFYKDSLKDLTAQHQTACRVYGENSEQAQGLAQNISYVQSELAIAQSQFASLSSQMISTNGIIQGVYHGLGLIAQGAERAYQTLKPLSMLSFAGIAAATATTVSFEDAWAGVTKTVDGTPEQMQNIDMALRELATTTASSYEELAGMGEIAGQMGVATDSVAGFVEVMAKLGDTTNLTGEEAASSMARIANIMVDAEDRTTDYYSRFGSTVVDLGNNFATTESEIVDMATRLASAGRASGMSTQQVLALSTALSSMGIQAAAGGGSMSKLMTNISKAVATSAAGSAEAQEQIEKFAKVSGMSADEFRKAWGEDAGQAFMTLMEGIGKSEDVLVTMNELGIDSEIRMSNGVRALAQSTDVYTDAMKRSNAAWSENSALNTEAEKRYSTVKSTLLQAKEAIRQVGDALGQQFAPYLKKAATEIKYFAKYLTNMDKSTFKLVATLLSVGTVAAPAAKGISLLATGGQKLIKTFTGANNIVLKLHNLLGGLSAEAQPATMSLLGFAAAHPVIAGVTAAVAALGVAYVGLTAAQKAHTEQMVSEERQKNKVYDADMKMIEANDRLLERAQQASEQSNTIVENYASQRAHAIQLRDSIGELIEEQTRLEQSGGQLSDAQKSTLGRYIDELNTILPELGLSYDSITGKITDNTGAVVTNEEAWDQLVRAQLEAQRELAKQEILSQQEASLREVQGAYDKAAYELKKYVDEVARQKELLAKKQKELDKVIEKERVGEHSQKLADEITGIQNRITAYNDLIAKAKENLSAVGQQLSDTTETYLSNIQALYSQAGDPDKVTKELADQFTEIVKQAGENGLKVPEKFSEGLKAGSPEAAAAVDYMSQLVVFNDLLQKGSLAGGQVTSEMVNGMMSNAGSIQEAALMLGDLMDFSTALEKSEYAGEQIPEVCINEIINGFANRTLDTQGAMGKVADAIKNPEKWAQAGTENAQAANDATNQKLNEGTAMAGTAGANAMAAYKNGLTSNIQMQLANPLLTNPEWQPDRFSNIGNQGGQSASTGLQTGLSGINAVMSGAMNGVAQIVTASTINTAAKNKATQATTDFKGSLKLKDSSKAEADSAAKAITGSNIAGGAASTASNASSNYSRNLDLVTPTRTQYDSVKAMIEELQRMASNPIKISVTKEIKTITTEEKKPPKVRARMMSFDPVATNDTLNASLATASYAARSISSPIQGITDSLTSSEGIFGKLTERMNALSDRMDRFVSSFDSKMLGEKLDAIANARGFVQMDGKSVGEVIWKPVTAAQNRDSTMRNLMMGVKG